MMTTSSKHLSKILIVILGVMTAFGPLTIDMYGPSLPKVQHAFGSSDVQSRKGRISIKIVKGMKIEVKIGVLI